MIINGWMGVEVWYMDIMEYYSAVEESEVTKPTGKRIKLVMASGFLQLRFTNLSNGVWRNHLCKFVSV